MNLPPAPKTISELQQRIDQIAGLSLQQIADILAVQVPENLLAEKGWIGQLLEAFLGATAGNLPEPDFQHLGIELKTIPITPEGKVIETTFVCVAPLSGELAVNWRSSTVYKKLNHVLWVPIITDKSLAIGDRQVAMPFLWQMTPTQEQLLQQDWEELVELISFGQHQQINASIGEVLQLRPKAANASVRTDAFDENGQPNKAPPKGFYLRSQFTQSLINEQFQI